MSTKLKLYNFNKRRPKYSDEFLLKVSPLAIAKYIQRKENFALSWRAARAVADAKIFRGLQRFSTRRRAIKSSRRNNRRRME